MIERRVSTVTGGAGFVGSHLVDRLTDDGWKVTILDNLSSGSMNNVNKLSKLDNADLKVSHQLETLNLHAEVVFHLAAKPEVRSNLAPPSTIFGDNVIATFNLLEAMRKSSSRILVFISSSTVYGEPLTIPTPEDYSPLKPISIYGASKLAGEALAAGYAGMLGIRVLILRLANVVGPRAIRGIVPEFVGKLQRDPKRLEVLGDGTQKKSYLHVDDCVEGVLVALEEFMSSESDYDVFNIGNLDSISSLEIARIVVSEMRLKNVSIQPNGGIDGGRGWPGDVKTMLLSTRKLRRLGWAPRRSSSEAIRLTTKSLVMQDTS